VGGEGGHEILTDLQLLAIMGDMREIRFHGRGGQGAVTAAYILVRAALEEGMWGQAIPSFGAERRGAHVRAYARIAPKPLPLHSAVKNPHIVVVLDPHLLKENVFEGVRRECIAVVNAGENNGVKAPRTCTVYRVDATRIARELGLVVAGWPVVNTAMLGAFARATSIVSIDAIVAAIKSYWASKPRVGELNARAAQIAYDRAVRVV